MSSAISDFGKEILSLSPRNPAPTKIRIELHAGASLRRVHCIHLNTYHQQ